MATMSALPENHPNARWMVVDANRTPQLGLTGMYRRENAQEEADELNDPTNAIGDESSRPFRVVRDIVAEDLAEEG